jgi:hypothetical protein
MENDVIVGSVEGTGAAINIPIGYNPSAVEIINIDDVNALFPSMKWFSGMGNGAGIKYNVDRSISDGGCVIGSVSAKEIKLAAAVVYTSKGVFKSLAAAEHAFTAADDDITADADLVQEAMYLLTVDAAGAVTVTKGVTADGSGNAVMPESPSGGVPIAALRLAVAAGATDFDATSDDLSAAHLTDTYYDLTHVGPYKVVTNGISLYEGSVASESVGFTIGADTDINVDGETIKYIVYR